MNDSSDVVIERTLDAPIDLVWKMWADPEHFKAWYGPTGARIPVAQWDLSVGASRLVSMEMDTPDGPMQMWFAGEFREVVANQRLVYTESMSDETGAVADPDQATEVIVELEDLGGTTKMVMTHVGVPADSPGGAGWNMALDKLVDYVGTQA
ncbi:MAG: SRPBCC domain-containing protein [Acidimicrobiales bacterium]|nr:SRPBCC domain-containing protein [Acidimicrobiales bacterium]